MHNCPNCGAILDPSKSKCEFCETYILDFVDFSDERKPFFLRIRDAQGRIVSAKVVWTEGTIEEEYGFFDVALTRKLVNMRNMSYKINLVCSPIEQADGTMLKVEGV